MRRNSLHVSGLAVGIDLAEEWRQDLSGGGCLILRYNGQLPEISLHYNQRGLTGEESLLACRLIDKVKGLSL
jgi:hypothetical protein